MSRAAGALLILGAAVLLLARSPAHAASMTLALEVSEAEPGGQVNVPVTADAQDAVGAVELELTFDPAVLNAAAVEKGTLIAGNSLLEFGTDTPGTLVIAIASLEAISGAGELVIISFDVVGADGDTTDIAFADARAWEGENHLEVLVDAQGATLTVTAASSLAIIVLIVVAVAVVAFLIVIGWMVSRRRRAAPA